MVSPTCPRTLQYAFPALFPAAARPTQPLDERALTLALPGPVDRTFRVHPVLDRAPAGSKCFVYLRARREPPICRLEM